jgi:hypothetical protein
MSFNYRYSFRIPVLATIAIYHRCHNQIPTNKYRYWHPVVDEDVQFATDKDLKPGIGLGSHRSQKKYHNSSFNQIIFWKRSSCRIGAALFCFELILKSFPLSNVYK